MKCKISIDCFHRSSVSTILFVKSNLFQCLDSCLQPFMVCGLWAYFVHSLLDKHEKKIHNVPSHSQCLPYSYISTSFSPTFR